MTIPTANFLSYNSTGVSDDKCNFINDLCEENDIHFVSIQEHFKICKTIDKYFSREFPKYSSYVVPAFRHKGQDSGRPKAGLAQLNKKNLDISKSRIDSNSYRVQAQLISFPTNELLWINVYFPTDPLTVDFDDMGLNSVLNSIDNIVEKSSCKKSFN